MRAANGFLERCRRVLVARVDRQCGAKACSEVELAIVDVDRGHIETHGSGILHRHVAEPANAGDDHPLAGSGLGGLQSLVDGDARAEDRRNVEEVDIVGKVTNIVGIGEDIFGKAAIDRIAGVLLFVAKRLPATQAMHAVPAGGVEPGHADPVAFLHMGDARTDGGDMPDAFMAGNEGRVGFDRPVPFCRVQVGMAHAGCRNLDQDLPGADRRDRRLLDDQGLAEFADDRRLHGFRHVRFSF